jgi:hypothetical protein
VGEAVQALPERPVVLQRGPQPLGVRAAALPGRAQRILLALEQADQILDRAVDHAGGALGGGPRVVHEHGHDLAPVVVAPVGPAGPGNRIGVGDVGRAGRGIRRPDGPRLARGGTAGHRDGLAQPVRAGVRRRAGDVLARGGGRDRASLAGFQHDLVVLGAEPVKLVTGVPAQAGVPGALAGRTDGLARLRVDHPVLVGLDHVARHGLVVAGRALGVLDRDVVLVMLLVGVTHDVSSFVRSGRGWARQWPRGQRRPRPVSSRPRLSRR